MAQDDPLSALLPKPPLPRPDHREVAIGEAMRRFDGTDESPSPSDRRSGAKRAWLATPWGRPQLGALLATALSFTNSTLIEQAVIAANRVPTGNLGQTAAPVDIYRTKDGWVLCQVTGHPLFIRWAKLMGEDHWLTDPRFADTNGWADLRLTLHSLCINGGSADYSASATDLDGQPRISGVLPDMGAYEWQGDVLPIVSFSDAASEQIESDGAL